LNEYKFQGKGINMDGYELQIVTHVREMVSELMNNVNEYGDYMDPQRDLIPSLSNIFAQLDQLL